MKDKDILQATIYFEEEAFQRYQQSCSSEGQSPHTLFIGCSDSRVVPNLITNTLPGELFAIRNIANVVPPYRTSKDFVATTSAIEYALLGLKVQNIIVCGHSNCGGCSALYAPKETFKDTPNMYHWLKLLKEVKAKVLALNPDSHARCLWMTEQINIKQQLDNLLTYPTVKERLQDKSLRLHGWYYMVQNGQILYYDLNHETFLPFA